MPGIRFAEWIPVQTKKALKYLSEHDINPIVINSCIKEYDELPDIFELINNSPDYL